MSSINTLPNACQSNGSSKASSKEQIQFLSSLRTANLNRLSNAHIKPTTPLDASLKNNLKWIKKLRSPLTFNAADLIKEMQKLKLEKYLGEVISALLESISISNKSTLPDSQSFMVIVSALHQRFGTIFTASFISQLLNQGTSALKPVDQPRDEKDRLSRSILQIRVTVESYLVGLFTFTNKSNSLPIDHLDSELAALMYHSNTTSQSGAHEHANELFFEFYKDLISPKENIGLAAFLVSQYRDILFSPTAQEDELESHTLVNVVFQEKLRQVIVKYYARLIQVYETAISNLNQVSNKNSEWYYDRGTEAPADLQDRMNAQINLVEHLQMNLTSLSKSLGLELPSFDVDPILNKQSTMSIVVHKQDQEMNELMWEDELEQQLYTDVPSLELLIPPTLLNAAKTLGQALVNALKFNQTDESGGADVVMDMDEENNLDFSTMLSSISNDDEVADSAEIAKQLHDLFNQLPRLSSIEEADMWAIQFCHYNTLRSQKRLVQALLKVQGHIDVLTYYGRILAILKPLGFGNAVCLAVETTVRRLARSKVTRDYLSSRMLWATYLSILLKFGLLEDAAVFYCLKLMFENPHPTNLEMICILLESCGRYLAIHPVTADRMAEFVTKLTNLKRRITDTRIKTLIANATVSCQPSSLISGPLVQKERSHLELYLAHLVSMLSESTVDVVASEVLNLDWQFERVVQVIGSFFIKLKQCRAPQLPMMARVLRIVSKKYPALLVYVVDNLIERIKDSLEVSDYQCNQQQLTRLSFYGYLLVYSCIEPDHVFSLMQLILALPVDINMPDFFRIRMVCTLLGICGRYLPKHSLSCFLIIFQLYISKFPEIPIDTQFSIDEMLSSLGVVCQQGNFNDILAFSMRMMQLEHLNTAEPAHVTELVQYESNQPEPDAPKVEVDEEAELEMELEMLMAPQGSPNQTGGLAGLNKKPFAHSPLLSKCFIDSEAVYQTRKSVPGVFVPGMRSQHPKQQLSLVTRRGAKMVVKALPIPEGSTFAQHAAQIQKKEDLEWQQMKKQILSSQKNGYSLPKH